MYLFGKQDRCNMNENLTLPKKIHISNYNNDMIKFLDAAYEIFKNDFIITKATFKGETIGIKKHPLKLNGKEHTFYHITHEGDDESSRVPNIERIERITYPRFFIDNYSAKDFLVWRNIRNNEERILIYHPNERYLVVLSKRKGYLLLWTAYCVKYGHTHRKLIQEYNRMNT